MSAAPILATWMYSPPDGDRSVHHQVGAAIGSQKVRNYYWRSAVCFFASAALHAPDARRLFFINQDPPQTIDGINVHALLARLGVEVMRLDTITRPPHDFHAAWNTQFIVIDALEKLAGLAAPDQPVFLLDSDCVLVRPIGRQILERIAEDGVLRYTLECGDDEPNNGLSNRDLGRLAAAYDPPLQREVIRYAGGEIFCGMGGKLGELVRLARAAFAESLRRHAAGQPKFNEEAHLLSYVYEVLGARDGSANDLIRRIWTDCGVYCNVDGKERELTIWHLPAEKKAGFIKMFRRLGEGGDFPADLAECERLFNLRPSLAARLRMLAFMLVRPVRNLVRRAGRG